MNQGKLEVVKQEMARGNVDILGISELNGLEWVNLTQMTITQALEVIIPATDTVPIQQQVSQRFVALKM